MQKFQQLWSAGITAHLDLDTHAGQAWVGLRAQLGPAPGHLHHHLHPFPQAFKKQDSPSCQRRRARGEAARKTKAEEVQTTYENTEEANVNDNVEETDKCENDISECSDHFDQNERLLLIPLKKQLIRM